MNFAPYAPPPDELRRQTNSSSTPSASQAPPPSRPSSSWFAPPSTASTSQQAAPTASSSRPVAYYDSYQNAEAGPSSASGSGGGNGLGGAGPSTSTGGVQGQYISQEAAWAARPGGNAGVRGGNGGGGFRSGGGAAGAEAYETRFSWRVDLLAAAAYLTPIPAILLLVLETRNDYVRIHAYHSLLLALPLAILHFVFLWSSFLQWILVLVDIGVYGWMAYSAYVDADLLERRSLLPYIGELAETWVEEE